MANTLKTEEIYTVEKWIEWKDSNNTISVETYNKTKTNHLGWDETDVLYSFLGVYVLGILSYYPDKAIRKGTYIKIESKNSDSTETYDRLYSFNKVKEIYKTCNELNENTYLKKFLSVYFSIGNVIPIWPGGNVNRGQSNVYDIPEIYFLKHELWTRILMNIYKNSFMDDVLNPNIIYEKGIEHIYNPPLFDFSSVDIFLNSLPYNVDSKDIRVRFYNTFLSRIIGIINKRTNLLS